MKQIITKEEVAKTIQDLLSQGKKPTLAAVHAAMNNRGSMSTLVRLKAEIDAAAQPATGSPDGLRAFREVWALAVEEGRKQQGAVLTELRETVKALTAENERLEGTALAAQNRAADLDLARTRAETELTRVKAHVDGELQQAKTAFSEASTQAASALQRLAAAQAAHATQVATLQADLTNAVGKAHELELQLVRATALLEAKAVEPPTPQSRKLKHPKQTLVPP
jgi:chromosome segregation ATPase